MSAEKLNIRNLTFEELKTAVVALGLPHSVPNKSMNGYGKKM